MPDQFNVLIVDDHAVIRTGIKYILKSNFNCQSIEEADSCSSLQSVIDRHPFTHLIIDLQLGDCNVIDIFSSIREKYPLLYILVYTMSPEDIFGKRLIQMGATGFLSKQSPEEEVVNALNLFLHGRKYISQELSEIINTGSDKLANHSANPFENLSPREIAVVNYVLMGLRVKEIAVKLNLKTSTVATYKARIFEKFGINNAMDLNQLAQLHNFKQY